MANPWVKGGLTVLGAIFFSTLGIFASDTLHGIGVGVSHLAGVQGSSVCGTGAVLMQGSRGQLCVDVYEASPSSQCPVATPAHALHTEQNTHAKDCTAISAPDTIPWSFVSLPQAQQLCAMSGKRLPTSDEWYRIALGTDVASCITQEVEKTETGTAGCLSSVGAYDVVGNVWEWVDAHVQDRIFEGRTLPLDGYVTSVDAHGIALTSGENPDALYGRDYFWAKDEGVFGMIRGGFYGSKEDAGLYTVNASVPTSFASQGVGFRCVKDVL